MLDVDTDPCSEAGRVLEAELGPEASATPAALGWRTGIEDKKLREHAGRFTSPAELAQAHLDLRRQLSAAIKPLPKDATDEQRAEYRRALGVPESPEDYQVDTPADLPEELAPDGETVRSFLRTAHQAGATPELVQASLRWFFGTLGEGAKAKATLERAETERGLATLKKEWGGEQAYTRNVGLAQRAAAHFGGEDFRVFIESRIVDGVKLTNHPALIRTFAEIGRLMTEDSVQVGARPESAESAGDRLGELTRRIHDAHDRGDAAQVSDLSRKRAALADRLHGTDPIVGDQGRTR